MAIAVLLVAAPSFAQSKNIDVRPFVLATDEHFAASTTFNAVLGSSTFPMWGGGVDIIVRKRVFVDLTVSRTKQTGQRAFIFNGTVFPLGIGLGMTLTPVELSAGYRFRFRKSRIVPYAGAGVGWYRYLESSDFSTAGEETVTTHAGFVMTGGAEFRVSKWVGITGDAQYTKVPGIFGQGGISRDANENDLGGAAARLRLIVGR